MLHDRKQAGQLLAEKLMAYADRRDGLVLALPRGGVPVAFEIAQKLHLPLDICLVRKLGAPSRKELAMGAIASGGMRVINQEIVDWLQISPSAIEEVAQREQQELERRERVYRGDRLPLEIEDKIVILVDDGIATGATLRAAIAILQQQRPKSIIVAVPVAPPCVCQELTQEVDQVVCLKQPEPLHSISLWYENFDQTSDEEVCSLLSQAQRELIEV